MTSSRLRFVLPTACFFGYILSACHEVRPQNATPGSPTPQPIPKPTLAPAVEPKQDMLFSSTREVRALAWDGKGLWTATTGGIWNKGAQGWKQWHSDSGLPANEAVNIQMRAGKVVARFPVSEATFDGQKWINQPAPPFQRQAPQVTWKGKKVSASFDGLTIGTKQVADPPSTGTHISALLVEGKARKQTLVAALYGDGLWKYTGKVWQRDERSAHLPANAREITAITGNGSVFYIGTRRDGVFSYYHNQWSQLSPSLDKEIYNANLQTMATYNGTLWGSTLDDGLIYRAGSTWGHVTPPLISSSAPRQMFVWKNILYVRHGGGLVDSFDGQYWKKNALSDIPRRGVYALGGDENYLYASGWGGWSEWDGITWTSHYDIAALKGVPILGIWDGGDGDTVWIGTQSRGLGRWSRKSNEYHVFDEREGLKDDWITSFQVTKNGVWAGTFVGGLAHFDGQKWATFPELEGQNVTSLADDGQGGVYAATRRGLWHISSDGKAERGGPTWQEAEVQAIVNGQNGLWIGGRTSLSFWKTSVPQTQVS